MTSSLSFLVAWGGPANPVTEGSPDVRILEKPQKPQHTVQGLKAPATLLEVGEGTQGIRDEGMNRVWAGPSHGPSEKQGTLF